METIQPLTKKHDSAAASNRYVSRALAGLIAILAVIAVTQILRTSSQEPVGMWICGFISLPATMAGLSMWYAFKGHNAVSRVAMERAVIGGLIVGGLAFLGGFAGPLIFTPESNVGPILGIIVTGPIGFLVGNVLGAIYGVLGANKQNKSANLGAV